MTAPRSRRHNTRPATRVTTALRPTSGTLMLIAFLYALGLPIVTLIVVIATDSHLQGAVVALAALFLILWTIGLGIRQRAGPNGSFAAMTAKTAAASAASLASLYGALWIWDRTKAFDSDVADIDVFIPIGAATVVTFVIVSVLLSSIRKAAGNIR